MGFERQVSAWYEFVAHERILPEVPPMVASSWRRCWARINPEQKVQIKRLNPNHFLAAQIASFELISIARPVMEDLFQYSSSPGMAIFLLNSAGYLLELVAEPDMQWRLEGMGINLGVLLAEWPVGTNAFALALTERAPVKVSGEEHFCRQFHGFVSTAAPIIEVTGRPLGVLGILQPLESDTSCTLALAAAGARAIEAQYQADVLLADYNSHLDKLNAVLDTISEGIIVWDGANKLVHINKSAIQLLDLGPEEMLGLRLGEQLVLPPFIQEAVEKREPVTDVETYFRFGSHTIPCVLSLRYVFNKRDLVWLIVSFRPIKEVRMLVQRQVGANALLTLDDIPGDSPQMKRVQRFVRTASPANAGILIRGEVGTGKNVLAGAVHNESQRRDGPFLIFACASVPNELAVSELLGYEEGGLHKRAGGRPSKFELAQGGTLYFQDVDALPLDAQAILLNVLEIHMVQRMGSSRPIEVDTRVIASTSAHIEEMIAQGSFRADLFYRLSTFTVTLPPLRERPRDIPIIAERILNRLSHQLDKPLGLGPGVMDALRKYHWPGNVREMEALFGPAATQVGPSGVIELDDLPGHIRCTHAAPEEGLEPVEIRTITQIERETILKTAETFRGNLTQMARALGIGRTTLWRKINHYDISIDTYRER